MFYILEDDKPNFWRRLFVQVRLEQNKIILPYCEKMSEKMWQKLVKKTLKIIMKSNVRKIAISNNLKKKKEYMMRMQSEQIEIVYGRWLYLMLVPDILDCLIQKQNFEKQKIRISVLVNDCTENCLQMIKDLILQYQSINIVTNHRERFEKLEKQYLEQEGILLTVTNNKKKSLMRSDIIVNVDFPKELINQYYIKEDAFLVNLPANVEITKKRFQGICVQDYEITRKKQSVEYDNVLQENFSMKELYEAEFYRKQSYDMVRKQMKRDGVEVCKLYLKNGVLYTSSFLNQPPN